MKKNLPEKKIFVRLVLLALITTPLFALLGGLPIITFDSNELGKFLYGIYFVALTTFVCWGINILLLLLAIKITSLKTILSRAVVSIACCILLSYSVFNYADHHYRPPFFGADKMPKPNAYFADPGINVQSPTPFIRPVPVAAFESSAPPQLIRPAKILFFFPVAVRSLTINLIILVLCELVFVYYRKQKIENENALLKQSNLEARNNQLKMQLHPHFLFNSLNTLRVLLKKDADKAEDYLLKLSAILRFSATAAMSDTVKVEEELQLCMNYLQMQKVRFGEMLHFSIPVQLQSAKGNLPVYALQLLAENAIKHNTFTYEAPLHISFIYDTVNDCITVTNKIQRKNIRELTTGIGLKNLDERYRLLSNQGIHIKNDGQEFSVTINILPPNLNA